MSLLRPSWLAAASLIALVVPVASPARAESLSQAVSAALNNHPSVEAAVADRNALWAEAREDRAEFFPQVSATGTGGRVYGDNSTSRGLSVTRGAGYSWLWEGNVTVSQKLFDNFATSNRHNAAVARRDSAAYNVADVREELALRVVLSYLDVLRGRESVARLQDYRKNLDSYITRIRKMVKEGAADQAMGVQARDIQAQLDDTLADAEGQLRSSIASYQELTGHDPDEAMAKPVIPADVIPESPQAAIDYAKKNHPMLKSAALKEEAYGRDVKAEKAAYFPDFTSEVSYLKRDEADIIGGEVVDGRAVVRMNWNYSVGGGQQARVRKSLYRQEESRAQREDTERQIARQIAVAYSDSEAAAAQMRIQEERVGLNSDLLKTHKAQFEAARVNLLQILQTDNALFNARLALMNGEYRLLSSRFAILASMGKLQDTLELSAAEAYGK